MTQVTIVIPVRSGGNADTTLSSLRMQTFRGFSSIVMLDKFQNANAARNAGAKDVETPFILFSDDDIRWNPKALQRMVTALEEHPECDFAYGAYEMDGKIQCNREFDAAALKQNNYISTMSLIRTEKFPGFDESIKRLQDWDIWLTMVNNGSKGIYVNAVVFSTNKGTGITYGGNGPTWEDAREIVRKKHGLQT